MKALPWDYMHIEKLSGESSSARDVARRLGVSPNTVNTRLQRDVRFRSAYEAGLAHSFEFRWRRNLTPEQARAYFWSRAAITANPEKCWIWLDGLTGGYGSVKYQNKSYRASILAWYFAHNEMPPLHVCHKCDNPKCVNPNHLFLGTNAENHLDKILKGRQARKLLPADAFVIKSLAADGMRQKAIAIQFGVSQSAISAVVHGRTHRLALAEYDKIVRREV